jgi:hypothetical protein
MPLAWVMPVAVAVTGAKAPAAVAVNVESHGRFRTRTAPPTSASTSAKLATTPWERPTPRANAIRSAGHNGALRFLLEGVGPDQ